MPVRARQRRRPYRCAQPLSARCSRLLRRAGLGDALEIPNPVVVFEVLSPGNAATDLRDKLQGYFRVPSIQHYLIVDPDKHLVIHHARGEADLVTTRIVSDGILRLDPPGIELAVGDLFPPWASPQAHGVTSPRLLPFSSAHGPCRVRLPPRNQDQKMHRKRPEDLRSHRWLGVADLRSFGHRSRLRQIGYDADDWRGKPVIGIINTWSEINPCHAHLRARAEDVKRGVLQAGGFPIELPAMSLSETVRQAVDHALPQLPRHGDGGAAAQPSDRRRRADGRLRQDHAGPGHGRDQHGHAGDLRAGRSDAARQLARRISRLRLRRLEILDGEARRQHHRGRVERDRGRHRPLVRHLHDDGHGRDHDGDRRGARPRAARRVVDPGGRCQPSRACAASPAGASSTWCGRT